VKSTFVVMFCFHLTSPLLHVCFIDPCLNYVVCYTSVSPGAIMESALCCYVTVTDVSMFVEDIGNTYRM